MNAHTVEQCSKMMTLKRRSQCKKDHLPEEGHLGHLVGDRLDHLVGDHLDLPRADLRDHLVEDRLDLPKVGLRDHLVEDLQNAADHLPEDRAAEGHLEDRRRVHHPEELVEADRQSVEDHLADLSVDHLVDLSADHQSEIVEINLTV
jgi:hypothetical protein